METPLSTTPPPVQLTLLLDLEVHWLCELLQASIIWEYCGPSWKMSTLLKKKKKDNLTMSLLCFCCVCCYDVWMCPLQWQRAFCCSCEDGAVWRMVERRNWKPSHCINWLFFFFWWAGSWLPPALFSSCGGRGSSLAAVCGPLPAELLLFPSTSSPACGLQQLWHVGSVMTALGSRSQAQQSGCTGLVAARHVGFFRIRAPTRLSCTGRRIPYHWPTKEAPSAHCKTTSHLLYAPF